MDTALASVPYGMNERETNEEKFYAQKTTNPKDD
jgi:hypothetical protein